MNELTIEQDNFFKVFLSKHQYFYMPYNNIYYEYDGKTYKTIKDDDIHHHLLSTITDEGKLMAWKHKTKQTIIKQIKERSLFKSVPETYTIQNVLGFLQTIFGTRMEAKYFLTVIGDCILKKKIIFIIKLNAKAFKLPTLKNFKKSGDLTWVGQNHLIVPSGLLIYNTSNFSYSADSFVFETL